MFYIGYRFDYNNNPYISKTRNYLIEKGSKLYPKAVDKLENSENETIAKIGEKIK